jgi:hypothetical protein
LRRASVLLLVVLGGCMKIYPDPELPDAKFEWFTGDCESGAEMSIAITGIDDPTEHHEVTAVCSDEKATIKDVSRQRYNVAAQTLDEMGNVSMGLSDVLDLRNGYDRTAYLYFGSFSDYIAIWRFDMDATCASLGANLVNIEFYLDDQFRTASGATCTDGMLFSSGEPGVYSVIARAMDFQTLETFAVSEPQPDVVLGNGLVTIGPLLLTPCAPDCPPAPY